MPLVDVEVLAGGVGVLQALPPTGSTGILEGSSAQYTWRNSHDVDSVVEKIGGETAAAARLDSLFTKLNAGSSDPYFSIGNQPNYWTPWAYLWAGPAGTERDPAPDPRVHPAPCTDPPPPAGLAELTAREREALLLAARGPITTEIAHELPLSP